MAVDPKLNNAAVLAQRAYNNAVASLATAQQAIATIKARGGTATAAQTAALTAAQNTVTTSSTAVKSAQMAVNAANNDVAVAAGTTGKAVSPAVDPGAKQQKPYNVQTTTGTGPTMSSSNGLLEIAGATALAMAVADPVGTARLVGSLFSSAKDILGVGGTTSSTTAPPAASNINESVFDPGPAIGNTPIRPASDPSQFPAYDDNGNLMPGFAINEENGGTYYKGFDSTSSPASVPLTPAQQAMLDANEPPGYSQTTVPLSAAEQAMLDANEPVGRNNDLVDASSDPNTNIGTDTPRAERIGLVDSANDPNTNIGTDTPRAERIGLVDAANDPNTNVGTDTPRAERIGLVDTANDPNTNVGTDTPRERPETGSLSLDDPYYGLTSAQLQDLGGADPTDPYIRARLGIPQLPGSELAATPGFGTINTGIPIVDNALAALGGLFSFGGKPTQQSATQTGTTTGEPVPTPDTAAVAQDATKLLAGDTALTDDEDQNLQNVVGAQGEIVRAEENIQSNNRQILANEESQAAAQEQQRQAQAIIDQNNAELADDNLPDDRRDELEANNAAQRASIAENAAVIDEAQNNIDNVTANNEQQADSIITNQGLIAQNSDAFTANGNELGALVVADNDTALSPLGNLFNFGGKPTASSVTDSGTTTGLPVPTPDTAAIAQDAAKLRAQNPALTDDEDQNLQNVVGAQGEIVRAEENIQSNNLQISANEEAQAAALEQQRQAQAIIDQNDAELADDNLPDDRRAELEANNAAQRASIAENAAVIDEAQTNIDNATANNEQQADSIITNQGLIAQNSDAFTANSENLGAPVVADNDPATAPPVDQNFIDANAEPQDVDPVDDPALEEPVEDIFVEVDETVTELTEEQTAALFEAGDPTVVDEFENSNIQQELPVLTPELLSPEEVTEYIDEVADENPRILSPEEVEEELDEVADENPRILSPEEVEEELDSVADENPRILSPEEVEEELDEVADENPRILSPEEVEEELDSVADENPRILSPEEVEEELDRVADETVDEYGPVDVTAETDPALGGAADDGTTGSIQDQIKDQNAAAEAAAKANTVNQATLQARYKQPASADWRVRLQLAPGANYLYKAGKDGIDAGILKPLYDTDGVIFPYTPSIETAYNANYEMYDLTHSNFRGYFYKNSRVNDISIRATFTAQDTQEAAYLLAVIHFFRSVTKMFYGAKDAYRGAPPPLTYLSGLGEYQFNQHPCVVSQFNYSLPPDVDYIRANAPNNYGQNMITQRSRTGAIATNAGSASLTRLMTTETKPPVGATATPPSPGMINQNVNNTSQATYVPTKIEISITLLPINTRSQVSTQFNMKEFASGALISKGFW